MSGSGLAGGYNTFLTRRSTARGSVRSRFRTRSIVVGVMLPAAFPLRPVPVAEGVHAAYSLRRDARACFFLRGIPRDGTLEALVQRHFRLEAEELLCIDH